MAKQRSFADKSKKKKWVEKCTKCNELIKSVRLYVSVPTIRGCKFKSNMVKICKCHSLEDYIEGKI